jgi:hypothetical protein
VFLRDEVPSLYPTMGSAFPMVVRQSVADCTVRGIRRQAHPFRGNSAEFGLDVVPPSPSPMGVGVDVRQNAFGCMGK